MEVTSPRVDFEGWNFRSWGREKGERRVSCGCCLMGGGFFLFVEWKVELGTYHVVVGETKGDHAICQRINGEKYP